MGRPRIYAAVDDKTYNVQKQACLRYYYRHKETNNIKRMIRHYKQLLRNNDLTTLKRQKYESKLIKFQEKLKLVED